MNFAQSIAARIAALPHDKQQEVVDFLDFIVSRHQKATSQKVWSDESFSRFSMQQAMRDTEDDAVVYTSNDLKERWL